MLKNNLQNWERHLFFCAIFFTALVVIWVRTSTVKSTYAFVKNKKKLEVLETELQLLKLKWTKSTSVSQLNLLAKNLGFHPLQKNQGFKVKVE